MKRHYKIALWVLIPLLFVGIFGAGLLSLHAQAARAAGNQATACDAPGNTQGNPQTSRVFSNLSVWLCKVNPVFVNDTIDCLHMRKSPTMESVSVHCFPLNSPPFQVVCQVKDQTPGEIIGGSVVWDAVATIDENGKPLYAYVADEFVNTSGKGFSNDTYPEATTSIGMCPQQLPPLTLARNNG